MVLATVSSACASTGSQASRAETHASTVSPAADRCAPIVSDSLLAGVPVYPECGVGMKARLVGTQLRPQYTPTQSCARAIIDVVIDARGVPNVSTARVIRVTDQALASAMMAQLPTLRFSAATKDGQPVAQIYRLDVIMQAIRVTAATRGAVRPSRAVTC